MAPGHWRMVAGSATALLLVGWIGLYQMGVPVWVPWTPRAEQPDAQAHMPKRPARPRKQSNSPLRRLVPVFQPRLL